MSQITKDSLKPLYGVAEFEYGRDWGSSFLGRSYFDNEQEAKDFVEKYNKRNNCIIVPDYYTVV